MTTLHPLENHYAGEGLRARLDTVLEEVGLGTGRIDWAQLIALDQFHSRGLEASKELSNMLAANPEDTVLDLGSGLGGPARFLAATVGCNVTGIELTKEYVDIATYLTERTGLSEKIQFMQGDATNLPFSDESFDHAWTIHVSMNIRDKSGFYRGVHRVLRSSGRFALYDVFRGENGPVIYPAPWSPTPEHSFLADAAETSNLLKDLGFTEILFEDDTEQALTDLSKLVNSVVPEGGSPTGITLPRVIGPRFRPMIKNMAQNFQEGRARVIRGVYIKT